MVSEQLQKKIDRAIKFLQSYNDADNPIEIAYSGGKDSDVILQLAKEAGINYRAIYKNTTIDPPGTIKHAKDMGAEILQPKKTFFELVEIAGFPNRLKRFCCDFLKEYKVLDKCVIGVRRSESTARSKRYTEPTACRYYGSKKKPENHVEQVFPILEWDDDDVKSFIADRKIKCHSSYYDENGEFHPERRLGCICCPQRYYKRRIEEFKRYPNMVKAYIKHGKIFLDTHPDGKTASKYSDVYEWFVRDLFFETEAKWEYHKNSLFANGGGATTKGLLKSNLI